MYEVDEPIKKCLNCGWTGTNPFKELSCIDRCPVCDRFLRSNDIILMDNYNWNDSTKQ